MPSILASSEVSSGLAQVSSALQSGNIRAARLAFNKLTKTDTETPSFSGLKTALLQGNVDKAQFEVLGLHKILFEQSYKEPESDQKYVEQVVQLIDQLNALNLTGKSANAAFASISQASPTYTGPFYTKSGYSSSPKLGVHVSC